jgi:hypothetical protein
MTKSGAAGSALYHTGGWPLVCISGICVSSAGFIAWLFLDYRSFKAPKGSSI